MKVLGTIRMLITACFLYLIVSSIIQKLHWRTMDIVIYIILDSLCLLYMFYQVTQGLVEWGNLFHVPGKALRMFAIVFGGVLIMGFTYAMSEYRWSKWNVKLLLPASFLLIIGVLLIIDIIHYRNDKQPPRDFSKLPIDQLPDNF